MPESMSCPQCSQPIPVLPPEMAAAAFCLHCGTALSGRKADAPPGKPRDFADGNGRTQQFAPPRPAPSQTGESAGLPGTEPAAEETAHSAASPTSNGNGAATDDDMHTLGYVGNSNPLTVVFGPDGIPVDSSTVAPQDTRPPIPPPQPTATVPPAVPSGEEDQIDAPTDPSTVYESILEPASSPGIKPGLDAALRISRLGHYRILKMLGRGGFSAVYLAQDEVLQRDVAIKVCDEASFGREEHFQRFLREARLGASLNHPNLCQIIDVQREDGVFYIVMEYVEGRSLSQLVVNGALPIDQACLYGMQLIEVLRYISGKGIVHRDVKSGNVMVCADRQIKLLDLGLGKYVEPQPQSYSVLTLEGAVMGTPAFMAPEQCSGLEVTQATDIYGAGVTLYELFTSQLPFGKKLSLGQMLLAALTMMPEDPRTHRPDLPDELAQMVLRMLSKQARDRPAHGEILAVLQKFADPLPGPQHAVHAARASIQQTIINFLESVQQGDDTDESVDDIMRLLPRVGNNVYLGEYVLKRRLGEAGPVATYEGSMPYGGASCFIRILPPSFSELEPQRLERLLADHGRLMQISSRSPHIAGMTFLGRAELNRRTYRTIFYTVEPWIRGTSMQTIIDHAEDLSIRDARRYVARAMAGLGALHENQYLHGNLHPAKLLLDEQARDLLLTDLTQTKRVSRSEEPAGNNARILGEFDDPHTIVQTAANVSSRLNLAARRQYEAPEMVVAGQSPSPSTEQYALGVIFIEALTSHLGYVKSARENLEHFARAREDLEDRLDEIAAESRDLAQVLWKMVKLNPRSRYASLREARSAVLRTEGRGSRSVALSPQQTASPPKSGRGRYDVFISYRREGGAAMARALKERLERLNRRVFLDVEGLRSGRFDTRLLRYINNSRNFLLVLTPGCLDRCRETSDDWLRIEISHAIKCRCNVVPVMESDFQMPADEDLPHALKRLRTTNGIVYDHVQFDGMVEQLLTFLK